MQQYLMVINNFGDVRKNEDDDDEDANKKLSGRFYIQMHRQHRSGFLFSIRLSNFAPLVKAGIFTKSNGIKRVIFYFSEIPLELQVKLLPTFNGVV